MLAPCSLSSSAIHGPSQLTMPFRFFLLRRTEPGASLGQSGALKGVHKGWNCKRKLIVPSNDPVPIPTLTITRHWRPLQLLRMNLGKLGGGDITLWKCPFALGTFRRIPPPFPLQLHHYEGLGLEAKGNRAVHLSPEHSPVCEPEFLRPHVPERSATMTSPHSAPWGFLRQRPDEAQRETRRQRERVVWKRPV